MQRRIGVSVYARDIWAEILERVAHGEPLHRICGAHRDRRLPERMTIYNWMKARPGFAAAYRGAVAARAALGEVEVWR